MAGGATSTARIAEVVDLDRYRLRKVENWYTKQEVARHFGFSTRQVDRWVSDGCPCTRWPEGTGRRRFRISEVEEWLSTSR